MFRKWFTRRKPPPPPPEDDGPGVLREAGQQIRIGDDIVLTVIAVLRGGAAITLQVPPHLYLQFPPADKPPATDIDPCLPTTDDL